MLLVCDSMNMWMVPQLSERLARLRDKHCAAPATSLPQKLRYIYFKLRALGYASPHHVTRQSSPRLKLLCLSWLILRVDVIGWYVKRVSEQDNVKVGLFDWDFEEGFLSENIDASTTRPSHRYGDGLPQDAQNNTSFDPNPTPPLDLSQMPLEHISKILTAYVRKIYLKGRFLLGHAKSMAKLHDESQKRNHMGKERLMYATTPKEISMAVMPQFATLFERHMRSMQFLTDIYLAVSRFYQWMDKMVTEEKLQSSGTMHTLDLDIKELKEQMRRYDERSLASLAQCVKELHEELLIEVEEDDTRRDSQHEKNDFKENDSTWWPQVQQYDRYMREMDLNTKHRMGSDDGNTSSTGAPFHLNPPFEHHHVILQKNRNVPSGVALEIKRLESILHKVEQRLDHLRSKHEGHLGNISKATAYEPK